MNNSKIVSDNFEENQEIDLKLQLKQGELSQVIEAINGVEQSEDWQKFKKLLLDNVVSNIERQLSNASLDKEINLSEIYRLQGQLAWARRYADLKKLSEAYRKQLEGIKIQLKNGKRINTTTEYRTNADSSSNAFA